MTSAREGAPVRGEGSSHLADLNNLIARVDDLAAPASGRCGPVGGSLNLEHRRKAAKRLLRAARAGAPEANARLAARLSDRARGRIQLSDALHVIAREQGYRSWPELKAAYEPVEPAIDPPSDRDDARDRARVCARRSCARACGRARAAHIGTGRGSGNRAGRTPARVA
jgi:hypothetical protein